MLTFLQPAADVEDPNVQSEATLFNKQLTATSQLVARDSTISCEMRQQTFQVQRFQVFSKADELEMILSWRFLAVIWIL